MAGMRPALTVLTDPVAVGQYYLTERSKRIARRFRDLLKPLPPYVRSRYRGHFAVTRSLVEGLGKIGVKATYNPSTLAEVEDVVAVLSGIGALRQAIQWKRAGRIQKLLAGPNLVVFPSDCRELLCASEVNWCVVPSNWVLQMYVGDCPELNGRGTVWPAGVDCDYWRPCEELRNPKWVLIFEKQNNGPVGPVKDYIVLLEKRGYQVRVLVYGAYSHQEYLRALQQSCLMVGFVAGESQGIAWAEAWSTDLPTLLWYQDHNTYRGRTFSSSTAPYLTSETGSFFSNHSEFESVLSQFESNRQNFHPREWVLRNMSDEVCAKKLCDLAGVRV